MATLQWALQVDLEKSSKRALADEQRRRVYLVLENCFRFFLDAEDLLDEDRERFERLSVAADRLARAVTEVTSTTAPRPAPGGEEDPSHSSAPRVDQL